LASDVHLNNIKFCHFCSWLAFNWHESAANNKEWLKASKLNVRVAQGLLCSKVHFVAVTVML
jgi:hypothetical protein